MPPSDNPLATSASGAMTIPARGHFCIWRTFVLVFALGAAPSITIAETFDSYRDFEVRIAVLRDVSHVAFGTTEPYVLIDSAGQTRGRLQGQQLYFVDQDRDGHIVLRGTRGEAILKTRTSFRMEVEEGESGATYLQAIRDTAAWRSSSLGQAPSYRGAIRFGLTTGRKLAVINELPLELYVLGVVPAEIGNFAPPEALKAQSIVARSEAYGKLKAGLVSKDPLYDFTDTSPQVYRGWQGENPAVRKAVDRTRGLVLTWHGQPVDAVYGHSCGGVVAEISEIWGGAPFAYSRRRWDQGTGWDAPDLRTWEAAHEVTRDGTFDSFCNPEQSGFPRYARKHFRWRRSLSAEELTRMVDSVYETGRVHRIEVERRSRSGRVQTLRIEGARKSIVLDRELYIRGALGSLKSTFFTFTTDDDADGNIRQIYIYGAGYGHGVGLCQMGAYMMAKRGYSHMEMLNHYFHGVSLERIYP